MAEAAVSFVLGKLADAAFKRVLELYHVRGQVEPMQLTLRLIQSFLRDADSKRNQNPMIKQWVKEVREVAHKIEDAIDIFLVEIEEHEKSHPKCYGMINKIMMLGKLDRFRNKIKSIRDTLNTINEGRTQLGITDLGASSEENNLEPFRPTKLNQLDDLEVVGFDADKDQIVRHLIDRSISRRTVLSIVGTGGLGKTTLAHKVFKSADLKGHFDCSTWLSISQKFNITNLLSEILCSIDPQPEMKTKVQNMPEEVLSLELKKSLGNKRYLIILDDVWTTDLWDRIKITLPDMKNGSRVLITTRNLDVAFAADQEIPPHKLDFLSEKDSISLLLKKALPHKQPNNYPPTIKAPAIKLAKKCGGLPLALIVLGGIVSRKECTYSAWHKVEQTMDWHTEDGEKCSQVLAMSFDDLPYHLKPYFLYFASFPEDYKISAEHVTRMWIAEGFIPKDGPGTLEDKAENYLEELVQRCMVQEIRIDWNGYCKYCKMHDLLRDLAIHEANEKNFFTVFSKAEDDSQLDARGARRVALQYCTIAKNHIHSTNTRSFLLFFEECISDSSGFRLIRVLTIERVDMRGKEINFAKWLKGLIHLRYLGVRFCRKLPGQLGHVSFRSLKNLETLDLKGTEIKDQPNDFLWKIQTLRNVISSIVSATTNKHDIFQNILYPPSNWDHLKNIQTLKWVGLKNIPELGCNLNLRKLGLCLRDAFWEQCGTVDQAQHMLKRMLKQMELLVSLSVSSNKCVPFPIDGTSGLPCHDKIEKLFLSGTWPKDMVLNVEMFPTNLTKLELNYTKLEQDSIPTLERLECLRVLKLKFDAYVGTEIIFSTGGFPSLQTLEFEALEKLCHWDIEEGAMPMLTKITIWSCYTLKALPDLQKVPTLKVLNAWGLSPKARERTQLEEEYKIEDISTVVWYRT